jgi:hypothetical protein
MMNKQHFVVIGIIVSITCATAFAAPIQSSNAVINFLPNRQAVDSGPQATFGGGVDDRKAPIAISADNVYIVWPTNKTGNDEVMFRSSNDNSATFADKINLSNSTDSESQDAEIAADGDNVIVTWWERNATSEEPVARISSDNGASFGPLLRLATNGTIGQAAAEE